MFGGCLIDAIGKFTEFHNPNYPEMDNRTIVCALNIKIYDLDVCQVRVDFNKFDIDQPTNGDCLGDKFRVTTSSGTPVVIPTLCGRNHNQHLYVNIPSNNDITERSSLRVDHVMAKCPHMTDIVAIGCIMLKVQI
ncbi:unnamed protein product [Medioppia subpectinata]|uniref:CUB domain-containing protein n=1 Tax=Medioppia subpectinata TaxID=1979941 RepID=A0A7R9KT05_9ACAR|nr:unnamed protein product [Medioppia subpectinata]CAG2109179.1 unnamed protein product [Medioppia subpectinata]